MSTTLTTLPPTENTLGREQRSRLLRSARKLEAVLGATPYLLDAERVSNAGSDLTTRVVAAPTFTPSQSPPRRRPATPQPPAGPRRPRGKVFHSPSSSVSSFDPAEPEHVFVDSRTRAAPHTTARFVPDASLSESSASAYSTPASSRSPSPMPMPAKAPTVRKPLPVPVVPHSGSKPAPASTKKAKGPQALAQPLLLRLRSVPVPPNDRARPRAPPNAVSAGQVSLLWTDGDGPLTTGDEGSKTRGLSEKAPLSRKQTLIEDRTTTPSAKAKGKQREKKPLSPVSSTFNITTASSTSSSTTSSTATISITATRRFSISTFASSSSTMDLPSPALSPPVSPLSPTLETRHKKNASSRSLTDREKRRKMAKLQRTLGENVPPELVFRAVVGAHFPSASASSSLPPTTSSPNFPPTPSFSSSVNAALMHASFASAPTTASSSPTAHSTLNVLLNPAKRTSSLTLAPSPRPRAIDVFAAQHQRRQVSRSLHISEVGGGVGVGVPLAVAETPVVVVREVATSSRVNGKGKEREREMERRTSVASTQQTSSSTSASGKRRHRPRSLTLGSASAFVSADNALAASKPAKPTKPTASQSHLRHTLVAPTRGTVSLDSERSASEEHPFTTMSSSATVQEDGPTVEWGRRKEREWSGEWNLKDMEEVAKALRGLKAH